MVFQSLSALRPLGQPTHLARHGTIVPVSISLNPPRSDSAASFADTRVNNSFRRRSLPSRCDALRLRPAIYKLEHVRRTAHLALTDQHISGENSRPMRLESTRQVIGGHLDGGGPYPDGSSQGHVSLVAAIGQSQKKARKTDINRCFSRAPSDLGFGFVFSFTRFM